jgi:erythromycin esterase-like protein
MQTTTDAELAHAVRVTAQPLNAPADYDMLLDLVGDARLVLLGAATHGTHEFHRERAAITKRLVAEKDFAAVAVEADWPDARRVDRYIRHAGDARDAADALGDFRRFPTWLWRNVDVLDFVEWLREHNGSRAVGAQEVGWYGLDLYNLRAAMEHVVRYLERVDPPAAQRVQARYACFGDAEAVRGYGFLTTTGVTRSCKDEAVAGLVELEHPARARGRDSGATDEHDFFDAVQNARLVKDAEAFYRTMFTSEASTWNTRERHMADTLEAVREHLEREGGPAKIVVWAHSAHLGDARATEVGRRGALSVGQLVRERHGREALLVGLTTHHGTVTAAPDWGKPAERERLRPAREGSHEVLFHRAGFERLLLPCRDVDRIPERLRRARLARAVGVVYRDDTEHGSWYASTRLAEQFDAVIHVDETHAVEPLEPGMGSTADEVPQTFPFGV